MNPFVVLSMSVSFREIGAVDWNSGRYRRRDEYTQLPRKAQYFSQYLKEQCYRHLQLAREKAM